MEELQLNKIHERIFLVREHQVMLDSDLGLLYQTQTKFINRAVNRNPLRFPLSFAFQLTEEEWKALRYQIGTLEENPRRGQHRKYLPWVFTEQGVAMLSATLNTAGAITVSVQIMETFVAMRNFLENRAPIFKRLNYLESCQLRTNEKLEQIFRALEAGKPELNQGIFFDGQIFDAYAFFSEIIKKAKEEIILIDNYIDENTLIHLSKKNKNVKVIFLTKNLSKHLDLDIKKANEQYGGFEIQAFAKSHDRFLIIDKNTVYHIGASLKDLGKKWFAFTKMDKDSVENILKAIFN